jgi:hypothetical protein
VSWAGLTRDLQGHPIDPAADVTLARLVAFRDLSPAQVQDRLAADRVEQADVTLYMVCPPEGTACRLSDFSIGGSPVDASTYFTEGSATWLVALASAQSQGAAALLFLEPEDSAEAATATIGDDSSALDVDVDLQSLTPVPVAPGPAITMDWSGLTRDGLGNEALIDAIDGVSVAHYDAPLGELEGNVFDLLTATDDVWTADVTGARSVDLAALHGPRPFPGVTADGVWLLALTCSYCANPGPEFVTVLTAG